MRGARLVAVLCVAQLAGMAASAGAAGQRPLLGREWDLSAARAGWVVGALHGGYAVAVPVLVSPTDRTGPRIVYLSSMLASALGALAGPAALLVLDRGRRPYIAPAKARLPSN